LTQEDAEHFLTKGWLKVPGAIKQEYIDRWMKDMYVRIGYDPNDKSTWHSEYLHLPRHREIPAEEFAPDAWNKTIEICGGIEKIDPIRERYYGDAFIINFGSEEKAQIKEDLYKPQDRQGWHNDDDWYRMFLDSTGNAMTVIHCFTDIPERGGGTWLCEDGMAGLVQYLYDNPEGQDPPTKHPQCAHIPNCKEFTRVVAKAGDVFLLHGLLPHAASPNYLHYPRVISNPHVSLAGPHNFNRPDGNYSLLEQVILRGLGRESLPEWKPARERKFWYPRNAGFKRAYAEQELARMEAHYKAQGLPLSAVDSIYQREGTQEWKDYEARNGFNREINPNGNLMEQHDIGSFTRNGDAKSYE